MTDQTSDQISDQASDWTEKTLMILGAAIALVHIYFNTLGVLPGLWRNSIHFAGFALMCPLVYPLVKNKKSRLVWLDILLGILAAFSAVYMISMEDAIYDRGVRMILPEWIFGVILILSAIELTRRTTGMIIPILIIVRVSLRCRCIT